MLRGHVCDMHTLSVGVIYSGWQDFPLRVSFILRWFYKSTQVVCANPHRQTKHCYKGKSAIFQGVVTFA